MPQVLWATIRGRSAMRATNEMILAEDGSNVVFVTGAPGSKWSGIAHALSYAEPVNNSDNDATRTYVGEVGVVHFGNYFGPGMGWGEDFDRLDELPKARLVAELSEPFREPGGVLLLKSHLFARHLDRLRAIFPKSRVLLVYRTDEECLDWWIECGAFSISFPDYSWYQEMANMRAQIEIDNTAILDFARRNSLVLRRYADLGEVADALGLRFTVARAAALSSQSFEREHGLGKGHETPEEVLRAALGRAELADLAWI
jgi:hypothetical protein